MHSLRLPLVAVTLLAALPAQTGWSSVPVATKPPHRSEYDVAQTLDGKVYLFGGRAASGYLNDTWMWDGKTWKQITTTTRPSGRSGYCMTYDFIRRRVIMFSGWNGGSYLRETWEFDGTDWKNVSPTVQPPPRDWSAMAYDVKTQKTILFGGHDWQRPAFNDTWAWDGKAWTQLAPKTVPPARTGHRMVFDGNLGAVVLIGAGSAGPDLWQWTGTDWQQVTTTTKPGYAWMLSAAFDAFRKRLVVYHGTSTWEFDGTDWARRLASGGPGANYVPAFYDATRRQVGVFGGAQGGNRNTPSDQMLFYGATNPAVFDPIGTGCRGSNGQVPEMSGTAPWLGEPFDIAVTNLPSAGSAFFYLGLNRIQFDLGLIGATGCTLYVDPLILVPLANSNGSARFQVRVPNIPASAGSRFYTQAWAPDRGANRLGVAVANGMLGSIGSK